MAGMKHRDRADFYLVIDDDTFIRMELLHNVLRRFDPNVPFLSGRVASQAKEFQDFPSNYIRTIGKSILFSLYCA